MKAQLSIDFISLLPQPLFEYFEIFGIKKPIRLGTAEIIDIPDEFFDGEFWKFTRLELISKGKFKNECILEIHRSQNHCYCFCDEKGKTYHLLFRDEIKEPKKEKDIKIHLERYKLDLDKYDTNNNKYRKRFILANATFSFININNTQIDLSDFCKDTKTSSYQLSVYNLQKELIVTKSLELPEKTETFGELYNKYSINFQEFGTEFRHILDSEKSYSDGVDKLFEKYKNLTIPKYFLNIPKKKIIKELSKEEYIDFFFNIMLFKIFIVHLQTSKEDYTRVLVLSVYFEDNVKKIKGDDNLKVYQKILLVEQFGQIIYKMNHNILLDSGLDYHVMSLKQKDSIWDIVDNFFKEYISNLKEDSKIFFKLLELDSGVGFYRGKKFYCFGMSNINEIKEHLKDIFIETLITYELKGRTCAFIISRTGSVAINISKIPNSKKFSYFIKLKENEKEEGKDVAAKIIEFLLHEVYGHKKFLYDKDNLIDSPCYFIEDDKIYFLDHINSDSTEENAIKILPAKSNSDDGTYYELCYGKIGDYYAIQIIDFMDGYGDLLDDVNLWIDDLDVLNDYFKYKFVINAKKLEFKDCPKNIRDKIEFFKKIVSEKKIDVDSFFRKLTNTKNESKNQNIDNKEYNSKKETDSFDKIRSEENLENKSLEDMKINMDNNNNKYHIFDSMTYEELSDLYYSGKLKDDYLIECLKRISEYDIRY